MKVQCNWCESQFNERNIVVEDDKEFCPICGKCGFLMDIESEEDY